ncbi:MAG: MFS transporter [Prosthecobacter sp.]|jgi:SHS family sialic acid transporter-like MFS transporter|uniref:MFS transporter n=1 Tax=Prosthecobacter sp. TaxID=1965333 RepID=UPI0019E4DE6E|nr:MFS transporter [Prosthecobacter sp.]MBE2285140.1 MFS transporter [Prosthecobacter sp.]
MTQSKSSSRGAVAALIAAFLGWLFDGFEMGLFPLIGKPALQDLLPGAPAKEHVDWFTVIIAVFLVGAATGGVLFGWLGDKLGRVKAMTLAIFTYAIFSGLCAFVTEAWHFAGLRFVASLGMGGEWALGVALVNEIWGGKNRAWIAGMIGAASNIGFLLTGLISWQLNASLEVVTGWIHAMGLSPENTEYLLHNRAWRFIAVSSALPALINFFILVFVPESHKWEEEKKSGGTSHWATMDLVGVLIACLSALMIIYVWSPMCAWGGWIATIVTVAGLAVALWGYLHPVRQYMSRSMAAGSTDAAEHGSIMRNLLVGASLAAVALLGTWGSAQQAARWASDLAPKGSSLPIIDYVVIATALGAILVTLITPLVADKLGRRVTYTLLCVTSLAASLAFFRVNVPFTGESIPTSLLLSAFLLGGITASFYGFFPLYFPELFPTSVRATGQGFCFNFGRLIAAIGALQLGNLMGLFTKDAITPVQAAANAYSILTCVYLVGMVVIWFAPETKGKALQ